MIARLHRIIEAFTRGFRRRPSAQQPLREFDLKTTQDKSPARPQPERNDRSAPFALTTPRTSAAIPVEHRLAALHSAARQKNSGPPQAKMRGFDRTRVTQLRIKRYTRAR